MSKFIVIEGPDRVGKATQAEMLKQWLIKNDRSAIVFEVPIHDGLTYDVIYWMLGNGLAKKMPKLFQGLQCLNRWIFQTFDLISLEHRYDYIIFDRWSPSTTVYGVAEGLKRDDADKLYSLLRKPDYTFVLLGESHNHEAEDVYEADSELQKKVRKGYAEWAAEKPTERKVLECVRPRDEITKDIVRTLKNAGLVHIDDKRFW